MLLQADHLSVAQMSVGRKVKKDFPNWDSEDRKTFENSGQGRIQAHMLISLLTRINVGLAACGLQCLVCTPSVMLVPLQVVVDDYELAPSTKQELRRDFRRRTLDWLTKQRTDFQDHRPWLAFRRLLAEHDRHIRSGLQPAVIFMAAVKDWVQCCKSNMHHIQYACPHMSEFFDIMTADGEWPQEHLLQHWLTPLDDLVVDGHENVLTSNTSFSKHWNPGVEFDPANQQAHMVQTNPAGQHIFVAEEGDGELAVQTATWMEHLPVQVCHTKHMTGPLQFPHVDGASTCAAICSSACSF